MLRILAEILSLIAKTPTISEEVKRHGCMSDFVILPSRLPLVGPGWAPDPLRANLIFCKFGLVSVKS